MRRLRRDLGRSGDALYDAVHAFGKANPGASFVQIGANDGVALDPLRVQVERRRWYGVMVEPVPYVYASLAERYGDHERVRLERCAVSASGEPLTFFHLREAAEGEAVWEWYHALGSFRRDVVLSHRDKIPDVEERIVATEVPCRSFDEICERAGLDVVDLVQMDTEGYDLEILRTIDFGRWSTRFVIYEHVHLGADGAAEAESLLREQGFTTFVNGLDTAAFHTGRAGPADGRVASIFEAAAGRSR